MQQIDFNIWTTQQQLANELNCSIQRVHNWIKRSKIEAKQFPELNNQVLVNRTSINIKTVR